MELEELKTVWQKSTQREIEGYFVSFDDVRALIKKRSNTTISQIKRGVRNKIFMSGTISLLLLAFAVYLLITEEPVFSFLESMTSAQANINVGIFYLIFGVIIGFISVFNIFSYRKINQIEEKKAPLKSSIKNVLAIVRNAMKAKIYSDLIVVPATVLALVIVDMVSGTEIFSDITVLLLTAFGAVGFGVFSYFLTRYGQHRRYGEQIEALEECLRELEE